MSDTKPHLFEPTLRKQATASFKRTRPPVRWVGLLIPIAGLSQEKIRIEQTEIIIGRETTLSAVINDESVSRRHARITRKGDRFFLEDLGSYNGTHVDGVPIISCVLHDGDTIQFGQNLYYFERVLEQTGSTQGEGQ